MLLNRAEHERYRSLVGALLYAANITRVDIAHTVGRLCREVAAPTRAHWQAAVRLVRYLKGTAAWCLVFGATGRHRPNAQPDIEVYTDADWGSDEKDRKSTSGCVVRFNGDVICWHSKKQHIVALSTTEAEYIAMAEAIKEALWFRTWTREVYATWVCPHVRCDNMSAIQLAKADRIQDRSKHIDIRAHFIRDEASNGHVSISHVGTKEQQADLLTKSMPRETFIPNCMMLMHMPPTQ